MTEQERMQNKAQDNLNVAATQAGEMAGAAVSLGRQVAALWIAVSRTAIQAAAKTLTQTSEMISSLADSMGELSKRVEGAAKKT